MKLRTKKVLYPELSYKIIGIAFEIFNKIGFGQQEKVYQKAFSSKLINNKVSFKEQLHNSIKIDGKQIGKYFLDFLVEEKIIVELKVGDKIYKRDYLQIRGYLKENDIELGIIILFSRFGVRHKRILNKPIRIDSDINSDRD